MKRAKIQKSVNTRAISVRFGLALRARREAQNISQEDLAELIGMHRTYYSAIERGTKNARMDTLARPCVALGARLWEVMREADQLELPKKEGKSGAASRKSVK